MEILLAALATGITEAIKLISDKFGAKLARSIVFGILFLLVAFFTFLIRTGLVPIELFKQYLTILTEAVGIYHLIIKPIKETI